MRCTKCGYISFDHLESCRKCHKPINDADAGLNGTVFEAESPAFLKFALQDQAGEIAVDDSYEDAFDELDEPEDAFADAFLADEEGVDDQGGVDLEDIMIDPVEEDGDDEIVLDLDALDDASPLEEFSLNADDEQEVEEESASPTIDFGDLDISDLAPPEMKEEEKEEITEAPAATGGGLDSLDLNLEEDTAAAAPSAPVKESGPSMGGLEDLLVDQLDLDKIDKPALGKRSAKPVKTGTALDSFDIDLGDLFTEKK